MPACFIINCPVTSDYKRKYEDGTLQPTPSAPEIDDDGTVFDGKDIRLFSIPKLPKVPVSGPNKEYEQERCKVELIQAKWIWACGREKGNIKNIEGITICSRHFEREAYNQLIKYKFVLIYFIMNYYLVNVFLMLNTQHL